MTITDELRVIIEAEVDRALRDMDRWEKTVEKSDRRMQNFNRVMEKSSRQLMLFSGALGTLSVLGVKAAASFESQRVSLETMLGSVEKGRRLFSDLQEFSAQTPLQLGNINEWTTQLLGFNVASGEVVETIRMLGDATQGQAQALDTATRAYGRINLKGTASMEELNMLTEAGVPILNELSKQLDVTTTDLFKMVSAGEVSSEQVTAAFQAMTGEGGKYFNMLQRQAELTEGKLSTMYDNLKLSAADMFETVLPIVNDGIDNITNWAKAFRDLDEDTQKTIVTLTGVGVALGPIATGIKTIGTAWALIKKMNPELLALSVALGAIAGGVALMKGLGDNADQTAEEFELITEFAGRAAAAQMEMAEWAREFADNTELALETVVDTTLAMEGLTAEQRAQLDLLAEKIEHAREHKESLELEKEHLLDLKRELVKEKVVRKEITDEINAQITAQEKLAKGMDEWLKDKAGETEWTLRYWQSADLVDGAQKKQIAREVVSLWEDLAPNYAIAGGKGGDVWGNRPDLDEELTAAARAAMAYLDALAAATTGQSSFNAITTKTVDLLDQFIDKARQDASYREELRGAYNMAQQRFQDAVHLGEFDQLPALSQAMREIAREIEGLEIAAQGAGEGLEGSWDGLSEVFRAIGAAIASSTDLADQFVESLQDIIVTGGQALSKNLISKGIATLPINPGAGAGLIALGGLSGLLSGLLKDDGVWGKLTGTAGEINVPDYVFDPIYDAEEKLSKERVRLVNEALTKERRLREENLRILESSYAKEQQMLISKYERNLLTGSEFSAEWDDLSAQYKEDRAQVESSAAEGMKDSTGDYIDDLQAEAKQYKAIYGEQVDPAIDKLDQLEADLAAAETESEVNTVLSAAQGIDFDEGKMLRNLIAELQDRVERGQAIVDANDDSIFIRGDNIKRWISKYAFDEDSYGPLDTPAAVGAAHSRLDAYAEELASQFGWPKFGEGGYVTKPTIALVGEKGPEFIVPAAKTGRAPRQEVHIHIDRVYGINDLAAQIEKARKALAARGRAT